MVKSHTRLCSSLHLLSCCSAIKTGCANVTLSAVLEISAFAVWTTFSGGLNEDQVSHSGAFAGAADVVVS